MAYHACTNCFCRTLKSKEHEKEKVKRGQNKQSIRRVGERKRNNERREKVVQREEKKTANVFGISTTVHRYTGGPLFSIL